MRKMSKIEDDSEREFYQNLKTAYMDGVFSASKFYQLWFPKINSYFFLFKKNLSVTNMQFAELISLLKTYITVKDGEFLEDIQFMSSRDVKDALKKLFMSFPDSKNPKNIKKIVELYHCLLSRIVIIDPYFGTCIVSLPKFMKLDLESLCGKSGYIHSCGRNIFMRNMEKASKSEFFKYLHEYLNEIQSDKRKIFFSVYSHEDHTRYDRDIESSLRDGLDKVKIFVNKCFMGNETLVSVLNDMREEFFSRIYIPEPGDYRETHSYHLRGNKIASDVSLWLISDQSINPDSIRHPNDEHFFICYEQQYFNNNQFHWFDENKPAWIAHTTIPHTLAGSMVNITKPDWPKNKDKIVEICDPFIGSGTVLFEAAKYSRVKVTGSDLNSLSILLVNDNIEYLNDDLRNILKTISFLKKYNQEKKYKKKEMMSILKVYELAKNIEILESLQQNPKRSRLMNSLRRMSFNMRLLFYIALRVNRRHAVAFKRAQESWITAFIHETNELLRQFESFRDVLGLSDVRKKGSLKVSQGIYSKQCMLNVKGTLFHNKSLKHKISIENARDIDKKNNKYDVIITDPPYGINTREDRYDLAGLYSEIIDKFIRTLKDEGQLVICIPEITRTGQDVPFFTNKNMIIQQVLHYAKKNGKEVLNPASSVPALTVLFRPPYYWESEKALRRSILHFRLKKIGS